MMVKPRFVPPGFPRYQEYYDKTQQEEKTWALRRDLKTGRSYGRIYAAADGTIIFRCCPLFLFMIFGDALGKQRLTVVCPGKQ
jgi:hypothetical protein